MPNNDMGNPKNVTTKTFDEAAAAMGQTPKDAKKNARDLLEKVLAAKEESTDKNWRP
jgi:predicted RNase H-like HicB family nuclease